jgi:hypothetical protein
MSNQSITGRPRRRPATRRPRRRRAARPAWWVIAVLVAAGPMLVVACGSGGSTAGGGSGAQKASAVAGGSPTASAKVNCANVDSLRRSLESVSRTSVSPSSAATLTADLKNIQTQLTALKGQGGGQFSAMTGELTASVNQIQKAAAELTTNPTTAIKQLTTALTGLKGKIQPTIKELNAACPK